MAEPPIRDTSWPATSLVLAAVLTLLSVPAGARPATATPGLQAAQSSLAAARAAAALDQHVAAAAAARARADAAQAAILAERQVAAAAALRRLENATGSAAARLAVLLQNAAAASARLQLDEAALMKLLPLMQRLSAQPAATLLAARGAPVDAVRGLIIVQGIAATAESQAGAVRAESAQVFTLLGQSRAEQAVLVAAVARQTAAEAALTRQIEAEKAAALADSDRAMAATAAAITAGRRTKTLQAVIDRLIAPVAPLAPPPGQPGAPVSGVVVQNFGDATMAGPAQGVSYRAAPGARVTAPCAGPVRFAQKFQNYGMLVILDCGAPYMFVLSGMTHLDVTAGQYLAHGQPVGEMRGFDPHDPAAQPVLYVELRQNGQAVDPEAWLASR